jgi:hypothetical protein
MKRPNKIYALVYIAVMMLLLSGCSNDDCNPDCGTVFSESVWFGVPAHGDEIYIIEYATECGELKKHMITFSISQGYPGDPQQSVPRYIKGDRFCK